MSTGLVHGYEVKIETIPNFTDGLDSFGIAKIETIPIAITVITTI